MEVRRELSTLRKNLPGVAYRCKDDDDRTLEFLSEGCLKLTGYKASDLLGNHKTSFTDLILSKDKRAVRNRIQDAIWERCSYKIAYRIRTAAGDVKWVWDQGSGVFSDSGKLLSLEGYLSDIDEHMESEQALRKENARLRLSMGDRYRLGDIIGKCAAMQDVYDLIIKASATSANVIVYGEKGTGKELVAGAIHKMSDRGGNRFVSFNCSDFS
ncbi:MAG: PAS domain-containing protein, partial [Desulfobacterales bacterium]|nr:PAS domain-containing protein [Desulfobacterales bacterium]